MDINLTGYTDDDDDDFDEEDEDTVQVSEAFCPHCHKALHIILESADHE